jgi:hypothetical protein
MKKTMTGNITHQIILSGGMPRAGSAWFYHLTRDIWLAMGGDDVREIQKQYHLEKALTEVNQNITQFTPLRTAKILVPYFAGKSFTIKIHPAPSILGKALLKLNWMRTTYVYRDPRDALLSAYEYGRRVEKTDRENAFTYLDTIEKAIYFMYEYMAEWEKWMRIADPFIFRYEDLLTDFDYQVERLCVFLGADPLAPEIQNAIDRNRSKDAAKKDGVHFSKGKIGRFRSVLTSDQIDLCNQLFPPYLEKMGYEA